MAGAIAPSVLHTAINGVDVTIECDTQYPFRECVNYFVTAASPVTFALTVRIPSWVEGASVDGEPVEAGGTVVLSRTWEGKSAVCVTLPFATRFESRPRGLSVLARGPLYYVLDIGEEYTKLEYTRDGVERKAPYCDYEIRPTTPWQFAFASASVDGAGISVEEHPIDDLPFSREHPAVTMAVEVSPIDWGWREGYEGKVARMVPKDTTPVGDRRMMRFKPYGSSTLRLTELPFVK